ncbi:MAG: substrate-binding domain-containing protein [Acidimicrobiales bacterium]
MASTLAASAVTLAGGSASAAVARSRTAQARKLVVAFEVGAEADPFFQSMYVGASAEAKKLGVTLIWQGDPVDYSPATQVPIVEQLLALKPNALIIAPTDPKALEPYTTQAIKQGALVFNVDSGQANQKPITAWVTGNNIQGGTEAADALASSMGYSTNCTGSKPCTVAVGVSSITTSTDAARLLGFDAELKKKYPHIIALNPIVSQSQPSVAQAGFAQDISAHSLKGIFAVDGTDAEGAAAAIAASGKTDIKVVAYDAYAANIASMRSGKISAIISQQPTLEGQLIVQYAVTKLRNPKARVPHLTTLPNILLTPSSSASTLAKYEYVAS